MIRTIIVDDEPNAVNFVDSALKKYCNDVEVVAKLHTVKDAEMVINTTSFDLLLLDIELLDGTGFDLLERIEKRNFFLIFITAYNQHAIKAFKFSAVDYLLKPLNIKELLQAIEKIKERQQRQDKPEKDILNLLENMQGNKMDKLAINAQNETIFVKLSDIIRLEAYGNYCKVYLENSQYLASKTLKEFESLLGDSTFFRVHHSHIVNIQYMKKYMRKDGLTILTSDGTQVPLATRRKEAFDDFLKKHFANLP